MVHRSISLRLTVWFSSVYFAGLVLFGAAMWVNLQRTLTAGRSGTLERRADRLSELLIEIQGESRERQASRFQAFTDATGGGLIEVLAADGSRAISFQSAAARAFPWPKIPAPAKDRFFELDDSGSGYRVLIRPFSSPSGPLVLLLAAPLEGNRLVLRTFSNGLLWAVPALLILSALGGYLLSRRALQPVDQISAATRSISVSNLSERLPVPQTNDELQRLSETCNAMLARLESAVKEIQRFTADASHEIRSPLSYLRTVAELAQRNPNADPASRKAFEEIVEECARTGTLLEGMLTLARADDGTAQLSFEAVDLGELVRTGCEKARLVARKHVFAVKIDTEAQVWGDYSWLQRLLWILIENAMKYTPEPGNILVSMTGAGETIAIAVEDNGIGISAADLPHIFDRFFRADPSRSRVEGSGLGLAIAKWIADSHRAKIFVASTPSQGSSFRVTFPKMETSGKQPALAAAARAK